MYDLSANDTDNLDRLLRIALCGPKLREFDPEPVLRRLMAAKTRRLYQGKTCT